MHARLLGATLVLLAGITVPLSMVLTQNFDAPLGGAALLASGGVYLLALPVLRVGRTTFAADMLCGNLVFGATVLAATTRGSDSPVLALLACAPLVAGLLGTRWRAVAWSVTGIGVLFTFGALELADVLGSTTSASEEEPWASIMAYGLLIIVVLFVSTAYEHLQGLALTRLRATELALGEAREQALVADRMASLGVLAAGVAHEINNPLTYVLGNLEFVAADLHRLPRQDLEETLDEMRIGVLRIRDIVGQLRGLSRPDDIDGVVEIRPMVELSLRMAAHEIRHRARVETALDPVPPVRGNGSLLGQVLVNLLVNAAQALPDDARDNVIRIRARAGGPDTVVVVVSDNGPGIPADIRERIFEPFFTTKSPGRGTGLGLAICRRIVSDHGGRIELTSTPGEGTTFRLTLPAAAPPVDAPAEEPPKPVAPPPLATPTGPTPAPPPMPALIDGDEVDLADDDLPLPSRAAPVEEPAPAPAPTPPADDAPSVPDAPPAPAPAPAPRSDASDRARLLIVDDEPAVARAMGRLLSRDHDVAVETDPLRALQRLRDGGTFDLVLCDIMMPGLTGPDLLRLVAAERPELGPKFVFISGGAYLDDVTRSLGGLSNRRLDKPVDPATLARIIAELA